MLVQFAELVGKPSGEGGPQTGRRLKSPRINLPKGIQGAGVPAFRTCTHLASQFTPDEAEGQKPQGRVELPKRGNKWQPREGN